MANIKRFNHNFWLLVDRLKEIAEATRFKTGNDELLPLDKIDDAIMEIEQSGEQHEDYDGPTTVNPKFSEVVLDTEGKAVDTDIVVKPITVTTVENVAGGNTLII